jgi:hypothetical protein
MLFWRSLLLIFIRVLFLKTQFQTTFNECPNADRIELVKKIDLMNRVFVLIKCSNNSNHVVNNFCELRLNPISNAERISFKYYDLSISIDNVYAIDKKKVIEFKAL